MYTNIINNNDKESKFSEKNQKIINTAFVICAHFILAQEFPNNDYMSSTAELKLKPIGQVEKVGAKGKTTNVQVFYTDEPKVETKTYTKAAWEKKQKKDVKPTENKKETTKKVLNIKEENETVSVTYESKRGKFMSFKKPVKYIISALLGYYCNDLAELRASKPLNEEYINESGRIAKFIIQSSRGFSLDKNFNADIFDEHRNAMSERFGKCNTELTGFIKAEFIAKRCFGIDEADPYVNHFKNFLFILIKQCAIFKANKFSISEQLIYTILHARYSDGLYDFKITDLITALKKDCEEATRVLKKVPAPKKTAGVLVPPKIEQQPVQNIQPPTTIGEINLNVKMEDFDVDGI